METAKGFKVTVTFTEAALTVPPGNSPLELRVAIKSNSHLIQLHHTGVITTTSAAAELSMTLQLFLDGQKLSEGAIQLGALCGKTLTGDYDKWVQLEGATGKVRLSGSLRSLRRSSAAKRRPSPQNRVKCPYLRKLASAEDAGKEIRGTLLRVQTRLGAAYSELFAEGLRSAPTGRNSPSRTAGRSPLRQCKKESPPAVDCEEEVCLELPSAFEVRLENLSSEEPQLLRTVVVALSGKVQILRARTEEYEAIQEVLAGFEGPMKDLEQSTHETQGQIQGEEDRINGVIKQIQDQNRSLEEQLKNCKIRRVDVNNETAEMRENIERLGNTNMSHSQGSDLTVEELKIQITTEELRIQELRQQYQGQLHSFENDIDTLERDRTRLLQERALALSSLHTAKSQLDHAELQASSLEGTLAALQGVLAAKTEKTNKVKLLISMNEKCSQSNSVLEGVKLEKDVEENAAHSAQLTKKLQRDIKDLEAAQGSLDNEQRAKQEKKEEYQTALDEAHCKLEEIQNMLAKRTDLQQKYQSLHSQFLCEGNVQQDVLCELAYFADLVFAQAHTGLTAHRLHSRLTDMIQEKQYQKTSLKKMVQSLGKNRPAYVARKGDAVDSALARYLNRRDSALQVNLVRSGPGVYIFGTRKVSVSLQSSELTVHFDSTNMALEDFIEAYTQLENEELDKRDREKRKSPLKNELAKLVAKKL